MPIKQGENRDQLKMLSLEGLVSTDDITRVIDAFVDALDMDSFEFDDKGKAVVGREAFSNKVMLKIYLFGYSNKVRSTRNLEEACKHDVRLWWLTCNLKPKYRAIADFRKNNIASFKKVFTSFTGFLHTNKLISGNKIAVDGTKIKASNSKRHNYSAKKLEEQLAYDEAKIKEYLDMLDQADEKDEKEEEYKSLLAQVQKKKEEKIKLQSQLKEQNDLQISTVDEDARLMQSKGSHMEMAYNVQSATDSKENLIIDFQVTNKKDTYALHNSCVAVKEILGLKKLKVLADKGYHTGLELKKCSVSKIETYVSPRASKGKGDKKFSLDKFEYNKRKDCYVCPNKKELRSDGVWKIRQEKRINHTPYQFKTYKAKKEECKTCPFRESCLSPSSIKRNSPRKIERHECQDYKDDNDKRVKNNKELYRERQQIVEHPFGTIKRAWGMNYTMLRTIPKVEADMAMAFLTYNLVRAKNILGPQELIKRIKKQKISFTFILNRKYKPLRGILRQKIKIDIYQYFNVINYKLLSAA